MYPPLWFRHSVQIARIERKRRRRQFDRSTIWHVSFTLAIIVFSIVVGISAYGIGQGLHRETLILPLDIIRSATTPIAIVALTVITYRASVQFGRIDLDHLLTTVPVRDVVLGVAGLLFSQYAILLVPPVISLAVGFAVGVHAPATMLIIILTIVVLLALIVMASITLSLTGKYLALRSPRFRRYRTIIVYGPFVLVWLVLARSLGQIDYLVAWLQLVPLAWTVDFMLLPVPGIHADVGRSVGAVCLLVGGLSAFTVAATVLGEKVWSTDEVSSTTLSRSRSLVGTGLAEWLFAGWVSRPVLTVARKRWVQERRVPRAFMMIAAMVLLIGSGIGVYVLSPAGIPPVTPLLVAYACATGFGLGFGEYVLAAEYPSLPMTLTTASGRHVIRGTMLAGLTVGVPLTILPTVAIGIISPVGALELLLVTLTGVLLCGCSIVVATALGMRFAYTEFLPLPVKIPLSSVRRVYGRMGKAPFLSAGRAIGVVGFVSLPAFISYLSVVTPPLATMLGTTPATVRFAALVVTMILAVAVSIPAYRRAVIRFSEYTLP